MRHIAVLLAALLWLPGPLGAETQAEKLARLTSQDFARQSRAALRTGDRATAIIQALKGLPAEPEAADLGIFSDAYGALLNAVVSRAVRLPLQAESYAPLDPTGTRVATISMLPIERGAEDLSDPLRLWDTRSGALIAELLPVAATHSDGTGPAPPVFSPDGRYLAMVANETGEVLVFAAADGALIWRKQVYVPGDISLGAVFSGDGRGLLTSGNRPNMAVDLWDVATGQNLFGEMGELGCVYLPVPGGASEAAYYLRRGYAPGACGGQALLMRARSGAAEPVLDLSAVVNEASSEHALVDPTGQRVLLTNMVSGHVILGLDGAMLGQIPIGQTAMREMRFVRGGAALLSATEHGAETPDSFLVLDLQGNRLKTTIEDGMFFTHGVFTPMGQRIGWTPERLVHPYLGADLPRGVALYDFVWANLPQQIRDQVAAERVERP